MVTVREQILETTASLMQRQGYCATGLNQIIKESGAPKGSLYHYFPGGKEELAVKAIQTSANLLAEQLQEAIDEMGTVAKGIPHFIRKYATYFEESGYEKGCPITTVTLETANTSEALQIASRDLYHSWCQVIIEHLMTEEWQEDEAREMAIFMMSSFSGALVMGRAAQRIEPLEIIAKQFERILSTQGEK